MKFFTTKRIIILVLLLLIVFFEFVVPASDTLLTFYFQYIFAPLQMVKTSMFNHTIVSIGDILYGLIIVTVLYHLVKIIYHSSSRKRILNRLRHQLSSTAIILLSFYLIFVIFWIVNYQRGKLHAQLSQREMLTGIDHNIRLHQFLTDKFLEYDTTAPVIRGEKEINKIIISQYKLMFGDKIPHLYTKHSIFGNFLQSMGIQGYYNPLTSEAQYNRNIPDFLHPFVIAHEMAHQMGVAAEDDANLIGYIICVENSNPSIQYSGYINLLSYNISKIRKNDSTLAARLMNALPQYVKRDLNTLRTYRKKYNYWLSDITIPIYNSFLKMNGQAGVQAYRSLADYAYIYELVQKRKADLKIRPYN